MEDHRTFQKFYVKHYKSVLSYVRYRIFDKSVSEEITDDIFMKFTLYYSTVEEEDPLSRLKNIAKSVIVDYIREINRNNQIMYDSGEFFSVSDFSGDWDFTNKTDCQNLLNIVESGLTEKEKKIYDLLIKENMKYEDIAIELNSNINIVKSKVKRMRDKINEKYFTVYKEIVFN